MTVRQRGEEIWRAADIARGKSRPWRGWQRLASGVVVLLLCASCGSTPLDERPPAGFDLSGEWLLDGDSAEWVQRRGADFRSGFMTQDFPLLVARKLIIEQDARSMGIEYERGSYRDVTWGERRRGIWDVRAGWLDGELHIYSDAPDTAAHEIWRLSEDGDSLTIDVEVRGARTQQFQRSFVRAPKI